MINQQQEDPHFRRSIQLGPVDALETYVLQPDVLMLHMTEDARAPDGTFNEDQIREFVQSLPMQQDQRLDRHNTLLEESGINAFQRRTLRSTGMWFVSADAGVPLVDQITGVQSQAGDAVKMITPVYVRNNEPTAEKAAVMLFHQVLALVSRSSEIEPALQEFQQIYAGTDMTLSGDYAGKKGFRRLVVARSETLKRDPERALELFRQLQASERFESVEPGWMRLFPFGGDPFDEVPPPDELDHLAQIGCGSNIWDSYSPVTGAGVKVGVVDDAFDRHPGINIQDGKFFDVSGRAPNGGADPWGPYPDSGHGTMVAGLIGSRQTPGTNAMLGVAPDCELYVASVGPGVESPELVEAITWLVADCGVQVLNLSLYSATSAALAEVINAAVTHYDVVVCAAAGSYGKYYCEGPLRAIGCPEGVDFPASMRNVIAVGATANRHGERKNCGTADNELWQSQWSASQLDVVAPGVLLWTTDEQGPIGLTRAGENEERNFAPARPNGTLDGHYYALAGGTSGATALVSGLAALIRSVPGTSHTAGETRRIIEQTCRKVLDRQAAADLNITKGYDYLQVGSDSTRTKSNATGYGMIDCTAAINKARP